MAGSKYASFISRFGPKVPVVHYPHFATTCLTTGQHPDPYSGAISPPINLTTTFLQKSPGVPVLGHYDYSRAGNPTVDRLSDVIAAMEKAKFGSVFSSGCGALTAILSLLDSGDHVICGDDVYGGTNRLLNQIFKRFGIENDMVDMNDVQNIQKHLKKHTRMIILETPTNPLLKVLDIQKICALAKSIKALSVVDNTFATPYLQSPIDLGADIVLHSGTKYIGGHSDVISGLAVTNDPKLHERLRFNLKSIGPCISPFDAWILLRSVKTMKVRMDAHCYNTFIIAHFLKEHPKVKKVFFPGLATHQNHDVAAKQMRSWGGMISFELKGSAKETHSFSANMKNFQLAESLGGVEGLISIPALMTHLSVPKEMRDKSGI